MRAEVVIDVSPEAVVNVGVNMLPVTADGVVVVVTVLLLERFGGEGYLVKVVTVAPEIGDAVNASRFVAVMTALELVLWTLYTSTLGCTNRGYLLRSQCPGAFSGQVRLVAGVCLT